MSVALRSPRSADVGLTVGSTVEAYGVYYGSSNRLSVRTREIIPSSTAVKREGGGGGGRGVMGKTTESERERERAKERDRQRRR